MNEREVSEEIKKILTELTNLRLVQEHQESTQDLLSKKQKEFDELSKQLGKELDDVNKLEKLSINSIFHNIIGNKEAKLDRERREYLEVSLKLKELSESLQLMEYENNILEKKVVKVGTLENRLDELKEIRESLILSMPHKLASSLRSLNSKIEERVVYLKEVEEARDTGQKAKNAITRVLNHLNRAIRAIQFDNSRNRRFGVSSKHRELDHAAREANRAQYLISLLQRELSDIGMSFQYSNFNIEGTGGLVNVFFDNLITDWILHNKIKNTKRSIEGVYDKLNTMMLAIDSEKKNTLDMLESFNHQKSKLLES